MSILDSQLVLDKKGQVVENKEQQLAHYQPVELEKERLAMVKFDFTLSDVIMKKPRRELNDLSILERTMIDQMTWATYQPNDGDSLEGDEINAWKSRAVRPVARNKVMSIVAHTTARVIFPKLFAFNENSEEEEDAATVMSDLIEWTCTNEMSTYGETAIYSAIAACVAPAAIVYTEYTEVYRDVKGKKLADGTWEVKKVLDTEFSGFREEMVPCDELYIADFYEPNIQRQRYLIRRRVRDYSTLKALYGDFENFKYVKPGVQVLYNDANQMFYERYDSNMRQYECEEIIYWNRHLDLFLIVVNGVLINDPNTPNPREDKLYPFAKYGYQPLDPNNKCFYYKSLVFITLPDEKVINTLYPMVIDATYLALFPPQAVIGGEIIGADVLIPGAVTTLSDPQADMKPLLTANQNLKAAYDALQEVQNSIDESSVDQAQQGQDAPGEQTAYQISKLEANAKTLLGLFLKGQASFVSQFARLRIGDIKQYLTLPEVEMIEGSDEDAVKMVYKTFLLKDKQTEGKSTRHRIRLTLDHPTGDENGKIGSDELLNHSYNLLSEVGHESKEVLYSVHPQLFRQLNYMTIVTPDTITPMTEELERAFDLEQYDRMVQAPEMFDPEETAKILLSAYPRTRKDPEKYMQKNQNAGMPQSPNQQPLPGQQTPAKPNGPATQPMNNVARPTARGTKAGMATEQLAPLK